MNISRAAARARARVRLSLGARRSRTERSAQLHSPAATPAEASEAAHPSPPRSAMSHAEVRTIFFGLMLAAFLAALNQTIIATALPTIGRNFGDFENLSWIVTAYLLTSTAVAPLYGKLSDIWGRRAMILAAIGLFMAGSAMAAAAPSMTMLILGRGLQGIGGGGILPLCQSVIADVVAPRERGRYQAYMGVVWVTSGVGGPVFGGFMAEHLHWSLIFWINVPLGLGAALLTHIHLKSIPRHDRRHKLDLLGAVLMMGSCIPLLLALTWGGTHYPWLSPPILGLIGLSFVLSLLFGWRLAMRSGAVPAAHRAQQSGDAHGHSVGVARHGRADRADHHRAALLRGGAQAQRHRIRRGADPDRADHAGLAALRPGDAVLEALQARADVRALLRADRD